VFASNLSDITPPRKFGLSHFSPLIAFSSVFLSYWEVDSSFKYYVEESPRLLNLLCFVASISDELWGIDRSGSLVHHKQLMMNLDPRNKTLSRTISRVDSVPTGTEDGDWEVVESPE